jgi:hypothetical protein
MLSIFRNDRLGRTGWRHRDGARNEMCMRGAVLRASG